MEITVTNNSLTDTLIISAPSSDAFSAVSNWTKNALAPGESAIAVATLPSTGYIGGNLHFNHNLHPSEFSISTDFSYYERVITGTIQNLRLNETSGAGANDTSPENNDGAYSGVILSAALSPVPPDRMPEFDGNDYVNLYSANLASDFDPTIGSAAFFLQAKTAAVWSDASNMWLLRLYADANNRIDIFKNAAPTDQIVYWYIANGVTNEGLADIPHTTDPFHIAFTWNKSLNRVRAYLNGVLVMTDTGMDVWSGALTQFTTILGLEATGGTLGWQGYLSQLRLYNRELTADEVASLSL